MTETPTETIETPVETQPGMQVSLPQAVLFPALAQCLKSVGYRGYPILSHVLLQASDENQTLTLTTNNLSTAIVLRLDADVESPGICTIPAKLLHECVKTFSFLEMKDDKLVVACNRRTFALAGGLNPKDFPMLANDDPDGSITLNSSALVKAIRETEFSAATDDSRPAFFGLLMDVRDDHVAFVACNTFAMAVATIPMQSDQTIQLLVPAPSMRLPWIHTAKHPYCKNPRCSRCHTNVQYHQTITGAPLHADVHEAESLAAQVNTLRGVMWDVQMGGQP